MNSVNLSRRLAEWVATLKWSEIPLSIREQVRLRVLDTTGLVIAGAQTEALKIAVDLAMRISGRPESTLIGQAARGPASSAALAHGVAAHCRDFDDTFIDSVVHPGSVIVPTAVAMAEARSCEAEAFAAAIVAGYEVAARIGAVAGRRFHARHLHPTGVVGPIAAAATAGRLLNLSGEQISWAMGLAASMSGGLRAFAIDGGWSKWLHAGWAAHGGIMAAELASREFRGPEHVLSGGKDIYSALLHGEEVDRSRLVADLGHRWRAADAEFKYYPCAHVIQPYIDVALEIVRENDLRPEDIASVTCTIAPWAALIVCEPRQAKLNVETELEAIGSLPFQLAVALIERRVDIGSLSALTRRRDDVRAMAHRILHRSDAALGAEFDAIVEIRTADGRAYEGRGSAARLDRNKLKGKFLSLASPVLGESRAEAAATELLDAARVPDWRIVAGLLAQAKLN